MAKARPPSDSAAPDQRKLSERQAGRLAGLTGLEAESLAGLTIVDVSEKLKWRIDPTLLLFRRICGRVVKTDPVTGVEHPVPFATVHVEDTDCSLLAYFPSGWSWGWFFPLGCHREVIATTTTDRCGRFCVWVPRFEIDWILRWRRERVCFPDIFLRPSIRDLLPDIPRPIPKPPFPPRPEPGPDPDPFDRLAHLSLEMIEGLAGARARTLAERVSQRSAAGLGDPVETLEARLDARAFDGELPPPMPEEFQKLQAGNPDVTGKAKAGPDDVIRSTIALHAGLEVREIEAFRPDVAIGPFFRCVDVFVPVWQRIVDVPDITFRVTQDVDGDGTEETIYGESYFDVRWNAGAIPDVTLHASSIARESHLCDVPDVPCGTTPAILFAGLMPLDDAVYFDSATGYATRPNRPKPPALPRPAARTPFMGTLQLYGCVDVAGAAFYRVLLSTDNGASFSAITGLQWNIYPVPSGAPHLVVADVDGWYPVLANPDDFHPANMLLEWPTPSLGRHVLKVEVGNAGKNPIGASSPVAIQVDNTAPTIVFTTLAWKFAGEPSSAFDLSGRSLLGTCPTIHRGATPQDVDVKLTTFVSAHHLRNASINGDHCDGGALPTVTSPGENLAHWHTSVFDNTETLSAVYRIASTDSEGAYTFGCFASSRAMNPAGGDGGHLADWLYDPLKIYRHPRIHVAVVNG
jgi:hypothetical protein